MTLDFGHVVALIGIFGTLIAAIWRAGTIGRTVGEKLTGIESRLASLEKDVVTLKATETERSQHEIEALRQQLAEARAALKRRGGRRLEE